MLGGYHLFFGVDITSYFWYSLEKELTAAGLKVYGPDHEKNKWPKLQIVLRSISDMSYQFSAQLQNIEGPPFLKSYVVSQQPPSYENSEDLQIENWSYQMINKMAAAILEDPDFQKAFFGHDMIQTAR